jgi:hypothetical protein
MPAVRSVTGMQTKTRKHFKKENITPLPLLAGGKK